MVGVAFAGYSILFSIGAKDVPGTVIEMVGEQVSLLYRPYNPARAQINSFTDRWLFPVAFTGGGIVAILVSVFWPKVFRVITGRGSERTP